ncbi:IS1595 family transposase [Telmatobacter bradus]|uniref:IS1595 family transposase n=1 Tax=Telmatobacter bradus TaxID=474953 RepID=UPI003B4392B6
MVFKSKPDSKLDYPGTWQQFRAWFSDEQACIDYLEQLRWPDGFRCPKCASGKGWRLPDGRWGCAGCARKVSVTAGTIFDRSRVPLADWFTTVWFMTNQKYGVSALGLQRLLGLGSYQTAWTMLRKLRSAMVRPGRDRLQGTVEVDETYVGGIAQGTRGRGAERKFMVAIAIEVLAPQGFGRVRLKRIEDGSAHRLTAFVKYAAEPGSIVCTDGWKGYAGLAKEGYQHHAQSISTSGDPAHVVMPGAHKIASLLKRWLLGTHQGSVTAEHLDAYLDEFAFRFNRRKSRRRGMLFYRLLENAVVTEPTRFRPSRASLTPPNHNP